MSPLDFDVQLDNLRLLRDGWLDGEGKAPLSAGLDWLHDAFESNYPAQMPLPHLYPTEKGGVRAEWSSDPREITLEFNLETQMGEWHELNLESDDVSERTLNCDDAADWQWLVDRIKGMISGVV